ncbi:MAG: ATP phosphoribosyltransferase [Dehalococcoidia bacterium]|nr:MAG: ATP phosphoribosyltransferase [Dehalococcoidia bacterium]
MKLALPKGRLLKDTAALLERAGLRPEGYDERSRSYRLKSSGFPDLFFKVFQERDIPIQVAIGNYDLGICGLDWVAELLAKYPSSDLVKVRDLVYGRSDLCVVASGRSGISSLGVINDGFDRVRIVSEYQNLAESFALRQRLRRFSILPIWGAGEVYPPESADLAIIAETAAGNLASYDLVPLARILTSTAFLIANRDGLAKADISELLACLQPFEAETEAETVLPAGGEAKGEKMAEGEEVVRIALPDGHLLKPAAEFLDKAGLNIRGYAGEMGEGGECRESEKATRRPTIDLPGVTIKVIRPQDMPLQVANENFDLAITGQDWLNDHLYRFPSSPVKEILKLGFGKVTVVAVVSKDLPAHDVHGLRDLVIGGLLPTLRVASEYVNIADKYARDNHLERCKIIPTWGASEAFLPEDADLLIENTETGETLARHNLTVIDTIFKSSACLIGHRDTLSHPSKKGRIERIIDVIKKGG